MSFKLKPPYNLDLLNTPMFERDMEGDPVHARTPKNGVIILNEDSFSMDKDPKEKLKTIVHELEHKPHPQNKPLHMESYQFFVRPSH